MTGVPTWGRMEGYIVKQISSAHIIRITSILLGFLKENVSEFKTFSRIRIVKMGEWLYIEPFNTSWCRRGLRTPSSCRAPTVQWKCLKKSGPVYPRPACRNRGAAHRRNSPRIPLRSRTWGQHNMRGRSKLIWNANDDLSIKPAVEKLFTAPLTAKRLVLMFLHTFMILESLQKTAYWLVLAKAMDLSLLPLALVGIGFVLPFVWYYTLSITKGEKEDKNGQRYIFLFVPNVNVKRLQKGSVLWF